MARCPLLGEGGGRESSKVGILSKMFPTRESFCNSPPQIL